MPDFVHGLNPPGDYIFGKPTHATLRELGAAMADKSQHTPIIKGILIAEAFVGGAFVAFWLWTGKATIPKHGGGLTTLDRVEDPYLYWFLLIAILGVLIAFPLRYLHKGPPKR
ncbi:hypothetical protein EOD04_15400 [Mesorhizobium sp. M2C.T.Ca.TU.009.01.2.1]|nr:hypothetical protein EOD04_15400 [Mesorhizobium sp. M2C.T.Ca.TU.009.01.2.1]